MKLIRNNGAEPPYTAQQGRSVRVWPVPTAGFEPGPGDTVIVIDLLRASTTIVHALGAGARWVLPVLTVEDARRAGRGSAHDPAPLLGGERGGFAPEGFDLGNSPGEYTPEGVGGRPLVFTTSNGTRAIHAARGAGVVLVGALVNLTATAGFAVGLGRAIHVLCAGTAGEPSEDDVLCAGAFVDALGGVPADPDTAGALEAWRAASGSRESLLGALRASVGGRNLIRVGLGGDIEDAARIDAVPLVARFDGATGLIVRRGSAER